MTDHLDRLYSSRLAALVDALTAYASLVRVSANSDMVTAARDRCADTMRWALDQLIRETVRDELTKEADHA